MLELVLSEDLRDNEIYSILVPQAYMPETRDATWLWFQQNIDRVLQRVPEESWPKHSKASICAWPKSVTIRLNWIRGWGSRVGR